MSFAASVVQQRNGWRRQAERLTVIHGIVGRAVMTVIDELLPPSSMKGVAPISSARFASRLDTNKDTLSNELQEIRAKLSKWDVAPVHGKQGIGNLPRECTEVGQQTVREDPIPQMFNEPGESVSVRSADLDKRVAELEGDLAAMRERLTLRENENRSLQTSLNLMISENSRLSRRVAESEAQAAEANEKRRTDAMVLNTRFEVMSSRALAAERLIDEVRQSLAARIDGTRADGREIRKGDVAAGAVDNKIVQLQSSLQVETPLGQPARQSSGIDLVKLQKEIRALDFRLQCELEKNSNTQRGNQKSCARCAESHSGSDSDFRNNVKYSEPDNIRRTETLLAGVLR